MAFFSSTINANLTQRIRDQLQTNCQQFTDLKAYRERQYQSSYLLWLAADR